MNIVLNGHTTEVDGPISITQLLAREGLQQRRVAVEVNREIIPRSLHAGRELSDHDQVEIIHAIGGG